MAHCRTYRLKGTGGYTWLASVRIFRKRGTWAYHAKTYLFCEEWGFKTDRAALMAASRWMKLYAKGTLLR